MERLTKTYEDGVHGKADNIWWRDSDGLAEYIEQVVDRLAEYEDTGLTPEEIMDGRMSMGWIPVGERLPVESLNSVIAWDRLRGRCCFAQYWRGRWHYGREEPVDVLAWMPMPEPYKQDEERP